MLQRPVPALPGLGPFSRFAGCLVHAGRMYPLVICLVVDFMTFAVHSASRLFAVNVGVP